MNGTSNSHSQTASRTTVAPKPPPTGPVPHVPLSTPVDSPAASSSNPDPVPPPAINGTHSHKAKRKAEPVDPAVMYENVRNRIAALEEEEVHGEEEQRKIAEEARKSIKGASESVIQTRYLELFQEMKRLEREHAREKQKLNKDKDSAKAQSSKLTKDKTKLENLGRELSKENRRLREDTRVLRVSVEEARTEILALKTDMEKRVEKVKRQQKKFQDTPDIVVKVVCKYRAELLFKITRKTKFARLFNAWTERMEIEGGSEKRLENGSISGASMSSQKSEGNLAPMTFIFSHKGRTIEPDQTPEDAGMEENDEILALEMLDLTSPEVDLVPTSQRMRLLKHWIDDPQDAKQAIEDIFDGVVRERLKEVLRQYELREKHFECVIRSKELEVLLSRARAEEQKQVVEQTRTLLQDIESENSQLKVTRDDLIEQSEKLVDELLEYCRDLPPGDVTSRLRTFLRAEKERRLDESTESIGG
ncbi:hypothetical protein SISNIDRAFT_84372 [Sistotremastrum niveocremeum HHB9708]|uniref:Ubiquitin-like domain-containing protein n=1 Tax=Sistotremastrum niveocremeum HHB9708 TaxID=1314777 RepID=A0A164USQ3_9AGAM|nr:hypothetical protein SISNIDRAFT_84372 [Sistotremastrum niveocremeum HHB9708]